MYGGGIDVFRGGSAKCILSRGGLDLPKAQVRFHLVFQKIPVEIACRKDVCHGEIGEALRMCCAACLLRT